jgi:hypothetical protein
VYSREIDGDEFTFGVSGKLIMNVLVMYDRQTESLWSQLLGEAVEGDLEGTKLEFLPSWQTTWADWKATHPETVALSKGFPGDSDPYNSYYVSGRAGVIGEATTDDRLYIKEFVVGVEHDGVAVAYPFSVLNDQPVVNDTIGDTDVLVVFNDETGTGVVFDRSIEGETLTFSSNEGLELIDEETGSIWNGLTGEAIDGSLAGKVLERVKSTSSFWFGWKDFHPDTRIFGLN